MRSCRVLLAVVSFALSNVALACADDRFDTTDGAVALINLDHAIEGRGDSAPDVAALLLRAQFRADYADLARALAATDLSRAERARTRAQVLAQLHRFDEARAAIDDAVTLGLPTEEADAMRARLLVATGHASDALHAMREALARRRDFANLTSLAMTQAELGHFAEADALYAESLGQLTTTLPFAYAQIQFARGRLWAEQAGDATRGEACYRSALRLVPGYVAAGIHLAELEALRGQWREALARVTAIAISSDEPEAWARRAEYLMRLGDADGAREVLRHANDQFTRWLAAQPLAFADHGAEFYLGIGQNPTRARQWACVNWRNRDTARARSLVFHALEAGSRDQTLTAEPQIVEIQKACAHTSVETPP